LRTEAEIDKMDGGDSGSELTKDVLTDAEEQDLEKQEKPVSAKGASKRKSRTQKESVNNGKQSLGLGSSGFLFPAIV
jgi:hypothetical protein